MSVENARQIFRQHPWLRGIAWGGALLSGYFIWNTATPLHFNNLDFKTVAIHSSIKSIAYYSRGMPVVDLRDGRHLLLNVSGGCQEYVRANDSLMKQAASDTLTIYRQYPNYSEVRIYGHGASYGAQDLDYPYSGLLQRYRIPHNPQ